MVQITKVLRLAAELLINEKVKGMWAYAFEVHTEID